MGGGTSANFPVHIGVSLPGGTPIVVYNQKSLPPLRGHRRAQRVLNAVETP